MFANVVALAPLSFVNLLRVWSCIYLFTLKFGVEEFQKYKDEILLTTGEVL